MDEDAGNPPEHTPEAPRRTQESPEVAVVSSFEKTRGDWTVFATWYLNWGDARLPTGPERIEVFLSPDADDETRRRGLTSTVLRNTVEPMLVELIRRVAEPKSVGEPSLADLLPHVRDRLNTQAREALSDLPRPRANPEGYYRGLLDAYNAIKGSGVADPVGVLQEALSPNPGNPIPRGTVLSRLRKARKVTGQTS